MPDYIEIEFDRILHETDKALLVMLEDGEQCWIPISQIAGPDRNYYKVGDKDGSMCVSEWFAKQRGWV